MNIERYRKASFFLMVAIFGMVSVSSSQHRGQSIVNVFTENINDSIRVDVKLKFGERGLPVFYFCHVDTPVCEQGLCKSMVLDVYWDVLGNFLKYEVPPDEELTKFDHLPFTTDDHAKLRTILADRASILRDYPVEDLVDHRLIRKSEVVDAVSAATRVVVRDAIVSGAVYSTYALWHIVNGPIADRIEEYTKGLLSGSLIKEMFHSSNLYYQYFALNQYLEEDSLVYLPEVISLVGNGIDYIPYFAIEKVPAWAWAHDQYQRDLIQYFEGADFQLRNAFLEKLSRVDLSVEVLDVLIPTMGALTEKQRVKVLEIGERNRDQLSMRALKMIGRFCDDPNNEVASPANRLVNGKGTEKRD